MWKTVSSHVKFCLRAITDDLQDRRWYVVIRIILHTLNKVFQSMLGLGIIALVLWLAYLCRATLLTNKRWSAIVLLFTLSLFLVYLTTAIRRFHEKTVADLTDDLTDKINQRSDRLKELCEVYGRAYQLNRQFSPEVERPTPEAVRHLAERLRKVLWACYGPAGTETFTRGGEYYSVTVPEDESKHSEWVYNTYLRLGDLIKEESPKQERLLPAHTPDSAFRS
jgi:hypothetical protein